MVRKKAARWFGALLACCGTTAQAAELLADLNTEPAPAGSDPRCLTPVGQLVLFCADDGIHGLELWITDGTPEGTRLLKDIYPGSGSSQPHFFVAVGSRVFFVADDGTNGWELWVTDGTRAGTRIVVNMTPGGQETMNQWLFPIMEWNGQLVFRYSRPPVVPAQLWRTDGTPQGTVQMTDLPDDFYMYPEVGRYGNLLYFGQAPGDHGVELWATDGTPAGTRRQASFNEQPGLQWLSNFVPAGAQLYFTLESQTSKEYWVLDAPGGSPRLVENLDQTEHLHGHGHYTVYKNSLIHGRPSGTYALTHGVAERLAPNSASLLVAGDRLYMTAEVDRHRHVYVSDGTAAGTELLRATALPVNNFFSSPLMAAAGNRLVFLDSEELWLSDGTPGGTVRIDLPGDELTSPGALQVVSTGTTAFVRAQISSDLNPRQSVWRSDGTPGGTTLIHDHLHFQSFFSPMELVGDRLFLGLNDPDVGQELFISDGLGTLTLLKDINQHVVTHDSRPSHGAFLGQHYYFSAYIGMEHGWQVVRTDGDSVEPLPFIPTEGAALTAVGERLFFAGHAEATGWEPWVTDGTPEGTYPLGDFAPGPDQGFAACDHPPVVGGRILFNVIGHDGNLRLFASDGTPEGTEQFLPWDVPEPQFQLCEYGLFGDTVIFKVGANSLWKTDGTTAGTVPFYTSSVEHWQPHRFYESNGLLYFVARAGGPAMQSELWRTDGTAGGTFQVSSLEYSPSIIASITELGDTTVFLAPCGNAYQCLYRTDGTPQGTGLMPVAIGGGGISHFFSPGILRPLPVLQGRAYLRGHLQTVFNSAAIYSTDGQTVRREFYLPTAKPPFTPFQVVGNRILGNLPSSDMPGSIAAGITDGTEQGTRRLIEFSKGRGLQSIGGFSSDMPLDFLVVGDSLLFTADDGEHGLEMWTIRNGRPSANADVASIPHDSPAEVDVLANDADIDGELDPGSVQIVTPPVYGTVSVNATTGAITYSPAKSFGGADHFTYTVRDDQGKVSNVAPVTVHVAQPVASPPPTPPGSGGSGGSGGGGGGSGGSGGGGAGHDLLWILLVPRVWRYLSDRFGSSSRQVARSSC